MQLDELRKSAQPPSQPPSESSVEPAVEPSVDSAAGSARPSLGAPVVVGVATLVLAAAVLAIWDPLGTFGTEKDEGPEVRGPEVRGPEVRAPEVRAPALPVAVAAAESESEPVAVEAPKPDPPELPAPAPIGLEPHALEPVVEAPRVEEPADGRAEEPANEQVVELAAVESLEPLGELAACTSDAACSSGNCSNGRCAPPGFAYIPPGRFVMGVPGSRDEPRHEVTIARPFFLSRTETTQREWLEVMDRINTEQASCGEDCPAEHNRWIQVVEYLNARSRHEGLEPCYVIDRDEVTWPRGFDCRGYRLPTEAEWEYAARARTATDYPCGDRPRRGDGCLVDIAWYRENSRNRLQPVGRLLPNAFGLFDVIGNAWEFVWDRFGPYATEPVVDPTGAEEGAYNIRRGCSYASTPSACGTGVRNTYSRAGVRPARSIVGWGE